MAENENIIPINIEDEMRGAYIDYSMSVIISRALPDVRDGLKPVHRRVLYGMSELGVFYNRPYKKSARIVGEVLGKYHPHGDASVYDTMVRMAQPWSLRYPLVDGQGNFGSLDGDSPAAMRYTEARLKQVASEMLADLNKNTVDFQPNFDDSLEEPTVMPSKLPNLLVNGTSGIAVGMATNMAPHNLSEVVDGIVAYINNPNITVDELIQIIKAPDFPTGGIIYGYDGVKKAFETGRGRIVIRSVTNFETTTTGRTMIVATEIPYQVNKAMLIEKAADLVNEKKIEGISAIRDESDRNGIRVVFELKKDAVPEVVLNTLFKHTMLQSTFSVNNVALVHGRPATLGIKDLIKHYVHHRHEVVVRRTKYDFGEAQKRLHILEGYLKALDHLDQIIHLIRTSKDPDDAKAGLVATFEFTEIQAKAILELRLQRLTGLERDKIIQEHKEVTLLVTDLQDILANESRRMSIIKEELIELKTKYGDPRRTQIVFDAEDLEAEDMIAVEDMVITITKEGYIKRTSLKEYRQQGRGGVGSKGVGAKDDDYTEHLFVASTHEYLLFFTNKGKVLWLKCYQIPEGNKTSKGRPLQNLIEVTADEKVQAVLKVRTLSDEDYINNHYVVLCTVQGTIKKTSLEAYSRPRKDGIIAINLNEGDKLLDAALTNGNSEIIIAASSGKAIRFSEETVRPMGRSATGVRGIDFSEENDEVVGMVCVQDAKTATLMVVSEKGYGKRSQIEEYRKTNRGGKGVTTLNITEKTGKLISIKNVSDDNDLMIMTKAGIAIRMRVSTISVQGRNTQGVRLIRLNEGDEISSVTAFEVLEDEGSEAANPVENPENLLGTSEEVLPTNGVE
ncbi:MAG: DNA gyrase subunit A [Flammeovirgaceae bacterium]